MIIDCISDLHGDYPVLEGGDLLICAGDCTAADKVLQWMEFFEWFKAQKYTHKLLVAGNHDGFLERCDSSAQSKIEAEEKGAVIEDPGFEYLCDSGVEIEGLKIWGSPWTPRFYDWHFMLERGERIRQKWALIPEDTDILVTHGPAFGVLDAARRFFPHSSENIGCRDLAERIKQLKKLKLHVFGHIHEAHGTQKVVCGTKEYVSVNASLMNREYESVNKPTRIVL